MQLPSRGGSKDDETAPIHLTHLSVSTTSSRTSSARSATSSRLSRTSTGEYPFPLRSRGRSRFSPLSDPGNFVTVVAGLLAIVCTMVGRRGCSRCRVLGRRAALPACAGAG
jgi:hypothetical protein